jgi:hypothetical protein
VKELSGSVNHEVTVKGVKVVVIGLPPSEQSSYRLIADTILGDAEGDLGLIFFDGINRLVLRSAKRRPATSTCCGSANGSPAGSAGLSLRFADHLHRA